MATPNTPIVNAGLKYVNGLNLTWSAAKVITIGAGAARDSTNTNDIVVSSTLTNTGTVVGVNGVDVAALVLSSMYAVYVIADSTGHYATASLLSLNATTPTLPFGYDMFRRVGWVLTDASANILLFWQVGSGQTRDIWYDVAISELSAGTSTTYAAIDLATSVPPIVTEAFMVATYTPNSATNVAHILPSGSSATNGVVRLGGGVAAAQVSNIVVPVQLLAGVANIQYKVQASDTLSLLTAGFKDIMA